MEDRPRELDVREVSWTLRHPLTTRLTLEISVYCTHSRVHEASQLGFVGGLVHDLGMFNFGDRIRFLPLVVRNALKTRKNGRNTHYLLWREDAELDFTHFADWCRRVRELVAKHGGRQETEKDNE